MTTSTPNTPASNDFALVPRELTPAMAAAAKSAGGITDWSGNLIGVNLENSWSALLAAAPTAPDLAEALRDIAFVTDDDEAANMALDAVASLAAAPASPEPASNEAPGRGGVDGGTGDYQPDAWQLVVDQLGYESIHETDEDGRPGDLVADVYGDNVALVSSAPRLRKALIALLSIAGAPITDSQGKVFAEARAALAASLRVSVAHAGAAK